MRTSLTCLVMICLWAGRSNDFPIGNSSESPQLSRALQLVHACPWMGYRPHGSKAAQMKKRERGCSPTEQPVCGLCCYQLCATLVCWCLRRKVTEKVRTIRATGASCSQSLPFFVRKLSTPANLQEGVSWVKMAAVPWPYPYTWAGDTATVGGKNVLKCWVGSR